MSRNKLVEKIKELEILNKTLYERSITDELTGLRNRRSINEYLNMEITMSRDNKKPLSITLFDLDDFSQVNNLKGHIVGDKVLEGVASILRKVVREMDIVGRYGGEEFIIIFPQTKLADARVISKRIREAIEGHCFEGNTYITISGGVYQYNGESLEEFINKADQNLYKAKSQYKNQII